MGNSSLMTIRDWLKRLPEPYKKQALMNTYIFGAEGLDIKVLTIYDALMEAFNWCSTDEGFDYWDNVHLDAYLGEFDIKKD